MTILREVQKNISKSLLKEKETIILKSIRNHLNCEFNIKDLTGRVCVINREDGSELYKVDGVDVILFHPPIIESSNTKDSYLLNSNQKYQVFNNKALT